MCKRVLHVEPGERRCRFTIVLSKLLLTTWLLGSLVGVLGCYLRVVLCEWPAADQLCLRGAWIESNSFGLYGYSPIRAPDTPASLLERLTTRPTGVRLSSRVDNDALVQLRKLRALNSITISGNDRDTSALYQLSRSAKLEEVRINYEIDDEVDTEQLSRLPHLSSLHLTGIRLKTDDVSRLARMHHLNVLSLQNVELSIHAARRLKRTLGETEVYVAFSKL